MSHKFKTSLHLTFSGLGNESIVPIEFVYTVHWGSAATHEQPAEGPTVGISKITVTDAKGNCSDAPDWLWAVVEDDSELGDELVAEARSDDDAGRELRDALRGEAIL